MKTIAILVSFATTILAGCKSMDSASQPESMNLDYYNSATFAGGSSGGLTVSLVALKDSRCPQNVICIQPGWVDLSFLIRDETDSVRVESAFHADPDQNKLKVFQLGDDEYALQVYGVLPLPTEGKSLQIEDYSVGLRITPR